MILTLDVETNTVNKGNPFTKSGKMISYSIKQDNEEPSFNYYKDLEWLREIHYAISNTKLIIGFNIKFDLHWFRRYGILLQHGTRIYDCQLAEFIITGQSTPYPSLDECLRKYGLGQKDDKVAEYWKLGIDTEFIPPDELKVYNNLDVELTYKLYLEQQKVMTEAQKRLCLVMGLDLLVLQEMEWNGIKFDVEKCNVLAAKTQDTLNQVTAELLTYSPTPRINLDSGQQLSCLLYGGSFELTYVDHTTEETYKTGAKKGLNYTKNHYATEIIECPQIFKPLPKTKAILPSKAGGKEFPVYHTSEEVIRALPALSNRKKNIIQLLLKRSELAKLMDTYYGKLPTLLKDMEWGDYIHGQFNQTVAATGRLSSSKPNLQNFSADVDELLISRYA